MLAGAVTMLGEAGLTDVADKRPRIKALLVWLSFRLAIQRSRRRLCELTDKELADIGISRYEAEREARKAPLF